MQHWPLAFSAIHHQHPAAALAGCIASPGSNTFAQHGAAALQAAGLVVGSWSVYRVRPDRMPCLHLSASARFADTTQACFRAYADGLYRADRSFDAVAPGAQGLLRMHADEVPNADHRNAIYRRHHALERFSLAARDGDGSLFAVNLYRHDPQGCFAEDELVAKAAQAPLLLALVQRHVQLLSPAAWPAAHTQRQRLLASCPALTARELDICERLLKGGSHDGIAADLGLSVATVKTYRSRAFARPGLHFCSPLFAAFAAAQQPQ